MAGEAERTPTVLITGAAGLVGRALVPSLRRAGWRTRGFRHRAPVPGADETVQGDLVDPASLAAAVDGADAVLHMAAITHSRRRSEYFAVNVEGTRNLLEAAARSSAERLVLISSRAASAAAGHYGESKLAAEELVRSSSLPFVILRLPEVYGGDGSEGVDAIVSRAARGAAIPVVDGGSQRICPVHIDDAIPAIAAAMSADAALGKTYVLAGECVTVRDFAILCAEAAGAGSRVVGVPRSLVGALSRASALVPLPLAPDQLQRLEASKPEDASEAREQLGFSPRPLRDGLRGLPVYSGG